MIAGFCPMHSSLAMRGSGSPLEGLLEEMIGGTMLSLSLPQPLEDPAACGTGIIRSGRLVPGKLHDYT